MAPSTVTGLPGAIRSCKLVFISFLARALPTTNRVIRTCRSVFKRSLRSNKFLAEFRGRTGVGRVAIRPDLVCPPLIGGAAAYDHLKILALASFGEEINRSALPRAGGGHQRGHCDDVGPFPGGCFEEGAGCHITAQVDHLETVGVQDGADEVLADIVNVVLDGGDNDSSPRAMALEI